MNSLARFTRVALAIVLLLIAAIAVPLKVFDSRGIERVERLKIDLASLKETNRRIKRENEVLSNEIRAFHSDPGYIEKIARDELGMVGPDEVIYQFPDDGNRAKK
ncbi:MAG: septum formation initiator family protein [Proteobacteria bacterium]|nr:septum formation initiator family protein [Pseudomonadota bacterium]